MNKLTHIIFLAYQPITQKFEDDFYFKTILQHGLTVEYWDVSKMFHKKTNAPEVKNESFVKVFVSYKQLKDELTRYKKALFIFHINYYAKVYNLFRLFSKQNVQTAFFARGAIPFPLVNQSIAKRFFGKFTAFKNKQYLKKAVLNQLALLAKKTGFIQPFTHVFYAGSESLPVIGYGYIYGLEKSHLVPVNSFDYDKYFLLKDQTQSLINEPYCVFLDVYLPFHPDFDLLNIPKVNATSYYTSLNNFFDFIEHTYNMKVIIAAHPKSNYENSNVYKDRTILKYKTAELIQQSEFVITHASTSISFAVLFEKPIIFTYNEEIKKVYRHGQYSQILHFANILKATCVNMDQRQLSFEILSVDKLAYHQYKYKYLTNPESEGKLSEDIFGKFLSGN